MKKILLCAISVEETRNMFTCCVALVVFLHALPVNFEEGKIFSAHFSLACPRTKFGVRVHGVCALCAPVCVCVCECVCVCVCVYNVHVLHSVCVCKGKREAMVLNPQRRPLSQTANNKKGVGIISA